MIPTRSTGPAMVGAKLNYPKASLIMAACASLTGCLAGPDYHRPSLAMPAAFKEAEGWAPAHPADSADRLDWWTIALCAMAFLALIRRRTVLQTMPGAVESLQRLLNSAFRASL